MVGKYTSPNKTHSVPKDGGGTFIGTVVANTNGLYVEIPKISPGQAFGPCTTAAGLFSVAVSKTTVSGTQVVTDVSLSMGLPEIGSKVICMFLDNKLDEVIVVGSVG